MYTVNDPLMVQITLQISTSTSEYSFRVIVLPSLVDCPLNFTLNKMQHETLAFCYFLTFLSNCHGASIRQRRLLERDRTSNTKVKAQGRRLFERGCLLDHYDMPGNAGFNL